MTASPARKPRDPTRPYHHGALREALLTAAEGILEREGLQGLTLRAAAREAGASHAAPMNHFGDLSGLLSELAAVGYERFVAQLGAAAEGAPPQARFAAVGRGYVEFALANPGLFLLMFRSERLDYERPALKAAMGKAQGLLTGGVAPTPGEPLFGLDRAARIAEAWSLVHGFSMLMIDGRMAPLIAALPDGAGASALLDRMLGLDGAAGVPGPDRT